MWVSTNGPCHVYESQRTTYRIRSHLPPCEYWGVNSVYKVWWQVPLPTELSCWSSLFKLVSLAIKNYENEMYWSYILYSRL